MSVKFSTTVKEIISFSFEEANRLGNNTIRTEHLLLGILRSKHNAAYRQLERMHVDLEALKNEIEQSIQEHHGNVRSLPLDGHAETIIMGARREAEALHNKKVEAEHLMHALLNDDAFAAQIATHIK